MSCGIMYERRVSLGIGYSEEHSNPTVHDFLASRREAQSPFDFEILDEDSARPLGRFFFHGSVFENGALVKIGVL